MKPSPLAPSKKAAMAQGARCDLCPLRDTGIPVGDVRPSRKIRLIIIGDNPGRVEEKTGVPFTGASGKVLDKELGKNGIRRDETWLGHTALCRGESDRDNDRAAECCAPRLLRAIEGLGVDSPILTLGKAPTRAVLGVRSLLHARGFMWEAKAIEGAHVRASLKAAHRAKEGPKKQEALLRAETLAARAKLAGRTVFPALHPSFVLRADTWNPIWQLDMCRVGRFLKGELPKTLDDAGDHIVGGPEVLKGLGPEVSCDIETDGIKPLETKILCIGFADARGRAAVIWPWKPHYAAKVSRFLRTRKAVVFHNGFNFDQLVMGAHGIDFEGVQLEDSLLAHHAYASHLPQRLDHVVSSYCDAAPWKIRFGRRGTEEKGLPPAEMAGEELTLYNAADARLTIKAWKRMAPDLEAEVAVYAHDKLLAAICRDMGRAGIGIDHARKEELSKLASRQRAALKGVMRRIIREPQFKPGQLDEVRRILFRKLRGRFIALTSSGKPSTANATLEALKGSDTRLAKFADALLRWRLVGKVKSTYIDAVEVNPNTGRTHYNWKPFGTVSGRLSCRLQSCPRYDPRDVAARPREMYVPRKGNVFVYFDVSQAEMRLAAYLSADPVFMAACGKDVHQGNAKNVFPEVQAKGWLDGEALKDPARGKPYRDISKNLGFAIAYGAEAEKVYITLRSKGFDVSFRAVELILSRLRSAYRVYYRYVESNLESVRKLGYMRTPLLGRIRWFGWWPKPTEVANFPVQSALADIMNARMIELAGKLGRKEFRGVDLVAQVHDSCVYDCPKGVADTLKELIQEVWGRPIPMPGGPLVLPIDMKCGERLSEL